MPCHVVLASDRLDSSLILCSMFNVHRDEKKSLLKMEFLWSPAHIEAYIDSRKYEKWNVSPFFCCFTLERTSMGCWSCEYGTDFTAPMPESMDGIQHSIGPLTVDSKTMTTVFLVACMQGLDYAHTFAQLLARRIKHEELNNSRQ